MGRIADEEEDDPGGVQGGRTGGGGDGEGSVRITFSLGPELGGMLRKEADASGVGVSTFLRQVLEHYFSWTATAAKAGFIPVPKQVLAMALERLTEDDVSAIAEEVGRSYAKEIQLLMRGRFTLEGFLENFELWAREGGMAYRKRMENGIYEFALQHSLGYKWSLYLAKLCEVVFYESARKTAKFDLASNGFTFKVSVKK
ncbi:hypothetical protein [Nitrososphaera sp.]|uniref:hypothetical protein n=1 Tax=Nitrososphaera sp. TaxID=1971748 RepID=UPI00307EF944